MNKICLLVRIVQLHKLSIMSACLGCEDISLNSDPLFLLRMGYKRDFYTGYGGMGGVLVRDSIAVERYHEFFFFFFGVLRQGFSVQQSWLS